MQQVRHYLSPFGELTLAADAVGLTGLWFKNQKYFGSTLCSEHESAYSPFLEEAAQWLDQYFGGENPDFIPHLSLIGTPFRTAVWEALLKIPYGRTMSYKEIAGIITKEKGLEHMSAQAIGGAVGHNPISIIIPCHRVIGSNGSLTGYAGGTDKKIQLLQLEKIDCSGLLMPER